MKLFEMKWICKGYNGDFEKCTIEAGESVAEMWAKNASAFNKGWLVSVVMIQNEKGEKI